MLQTDLFKYQNPKYNPGGNSIKRLLWFYTNAIFFKTSLLPISAVKRTLLRLFGASIAKGVVIKPCVNIKYPWNLTIGQNTWIGENVWIDSLVNITIGANACLSQGSIILTGSHNYKKPTFDLITNPVILGDGVWIGAGAIVNNGITAQSHSVLTAGSVAIKNMDAYTIYQGNPAVKVRMRDMS
jgi:putative colanic acid biosynthesis acetyltransferase WcaF